MLCHCYVMLCYVMLCYVMLCYVMLCYVMLCYVKCFMSHNLIPFFLDWFVLFGKLIVSRDNYAVF